MKENTTTRTGGELIVDQLIAEGIEHVFCVPGESYLAVLDAFHDRDVKVTVCRQEGGAAMMAEAAGKLTGRPGICFVTRGPGATNASPGLHIARQDSTPMILFVGQVERGMREREAFQELDYRAVFGTIAKWVTEIDDVVRIPELIGRAVQVATSGRPGPVVIALPEDVLVETSTVQPAPAREPIETWPGLTDMMKLQKMLWAAKRPMLLLGGSRWSDKACRQIARFAQAFDLPVATTFRRADRFDPLHPNYAGDLGIGPNPKLLARIKSSDLVILVGGRLSEMPSQSYTLFDIPSPRQTFVHVHPGAEELGRVYRPALALHAAPTAFAAAAEGLQPPQVLPWAGTAAEAHAEFLAWTDKPTPMPGALNMAEIMVGLRDVLPHDAIICNGAGNYAGWVHRFHRYRAFGTQLAPTSGSMGYGLPAAVGAKRLMPERTVIAFAGDGCFLMNGQEFATAVQYDLPVITIIVDNRMYGTIRMHQEREYPGRVSATALKNPDFAALARAYGGHGATVTTTAEFAPAFEAARASGKPAILHVLIDPDAISPTTTLTAIREKALAAKG
jgi:acetolactate synthase-1/2/3 large subunit